MRKFFKACALGKPRTIKSCLKAGLDINVEGRSEDIPIFAENEPLEEKLWTGVMYAVEARNTETLEFLLDNGAEIDPVPKKGRRSTPALLAAYRRYGKHGLAPRGPSPETFAYLVGRGADINVREYSENGDGKNPFEYALDMVYENSPEAWDKLDVHPYLKIIETCVDAGADLRFANSEGLGIFHLLWYYSYQSGYTRGNEYLPAYDALLEKICGKFDPEDLERILTVSSVPGVDAPLFFAAKRGRGLFYLTKLKNRNARDPEGNTVLHHFAANGFYEACFTAIEPRYRIACDPETRNDAGERPVDIATDGSVKRYLEEAKK